MKTFIQRLYLHDDVIKWKHFSCYWPFVRGIHRWPVNSPHKGQRCGALMFSLICAWISDWVNNREAGDLRGHRAHFDVTVMYATPFRNHSSPPRLLFADYAIVMISTYSQSQADYGRHIYRWWSIRIFFNENDWISIKIPPNFVLRCPVNHKLALFQIMVWHRTGDKPLSEPMMV